jgi:hypothetical protein
MLSLLAVIITFLTIFQTGAVAATKCQNVGDSQTIKGVTQICTKVGNSKIWQVQKKNTTSSPQLSQADLSVKSGCNLFWPKVNEYRASRANGQNNLIPLGELNGYFLTAQLADSKYVPLWNAFALIIRIIQGTPSDASLYDKQQAVALFNSYCNAGLVLS